MKTYKERKKKMKKVTKGDSGRMTGVGKEWQSDLERRRRNKK
jgi:hypothetical protein